MANNRYTNSKRPPTLWANFWVPGNYTFLPVFQPQPGTTVPYRALNIISYEWVGMETCFSVAMASSAFHRLVTVFHWV